MAKEILYWLLTALSITGVILNIKKMKVCFLIWIFTNGAWCIVDTIEGLYQQAFLFFIYFILAIVGFITWKKGA